MAHSKSIDPKLIAEDNPGYAQGGFISPAMPSLLSIGSTLSRFIAAHPFPLPPIPKEKPKEDPMEIEHMGKKYWMDLEMYKAQKDLEDKITLKSYFTSPFPPPPPPPMTNPEIEPDYEMDIAAGKIKEGDVFSDNRCDIYKLVGGRAVFVANAYPEIPAPSPVFNPAPLKKRIKELEDMGSTPVRGERGKGILEYIKDEAGSIKSYSKLTMETLTGAIDSLMGAPLAGGKEFSMMFGSAGGLREFNEAMRAHAFNEYGLSRVPEGFIRSVPKLNDQELTLLIKMYSDEEVVYDIPEAERNDYRRILHQELDRRGRGWTINPRTEEQKVWDAREDMRKNPYTIGVDPFDKADKAVQAEHQIIIKPRGMGRSYLQQTGIYQELTRKYAINPPTPSPGGSPSGGDKGMTFKKRVEAMMKLVRKGGNK